MAEISFQEEQNFAPQVSTAPQYSIFIRMVIATGLAQDELGASRVLLGVAVLIALLAVGLYFFASSGGTPPSAGKPSPIVPPPTMVPNGSTGPVAPTGALHFQ